MLSGYAILFVSAIYVIISLVFTIAGVLLWIIDRE